MTPSYIAIVNDTSLLTDAAVLPVVAAIQKQIDLDFGPAWNVFARLEAIPHGHVPQLGSWVVVLRDECDAPGALGYHTDETLPWGLVGVQVAIEEHMAWSSVLSHEVLEMMADPWATLCYQAGDRLYAYEICDPTEGLPYAIDGVQVENFILPNWFRRGSSGPWDHCQRLTSPLALGPGGYDSFTDIGHWAQENNSRVRASKFDVSSLSRRGRRRWAGR